MDISRSKILRWVVTALLVALFISFAPYASAAGRQASTAEARAEASRLMSLVEGATRKAPRSASSEPRWAGASTGEPLLLHSIDGNPTSFVVPVLDSAGKVISTIGVSAATGKWSWYSEGSQPRFPLVSATEATAEARSYLRQRGIDASPPEPQARVAPDKNTYWFFELGGNLSIKEVYLPVFVEGKPSSDVDGKPWLKQPATAKSVSSASQQPPNSGLVAPGKPSASTAGRSVATAAPSLYPGGAPSAYDIAGVPYHEQETDHWCGPASLEMLMNYYGEDIPQREIADVVNADVYGSAYNDDLVRAAHFSSESTAAADPSLRGYTSRSLGYGSASAYWEDGSSLYSRRYSDLKELVSQNYPVLILTYYDTPPSSGHFRLVKGYNDNIGDFIVNDPWYTPPYQGPDVHFNQSFLVDTLWNYSDRWGMIAVPWSVDVNKPLSVTRGEVFTVSSNVSYNAPSPLSGQYSCAAGTPTATFRSSGGYQLVSGAVNQTIPGIGASGSSGTVSWKVKALTSKSTDDIRIVAQGQIQGDSYTYPTYYDWIGGIGTGPGAPPQTSRTWGMDSVGVSSASTSWYLAEGCTNGGFETWVLVQNPGNTAAHIGLTYMTPNGPVTGPTATLPANSRKSFSVADTVPNQWSVSTKVTSDRAVVAERSMYFGNRREGHDSVGVTAPSSTWYLAEGCTNGGMETWVLVQNPNAQSAKVTLTYMTTAGPVKGPTVNIKGNSRQTFFVADTVPNQWSVSTKVTSDRPVIAERAVYGTSGGSRTWGTDSVGVPAAAGTWYLAEGCTNGGFETWVLVQNPNSAAVQVNLTYMTPDGAKAGPSVSIPPNSRQTFNVADSVPGAWEVSTKVSSNRPVIAERSMYGGNRTWGHDSVGTSSPATKWYLAEGCTQNGFETWVLVQNPGDSQADIDITFMTPSGPVPGPVETLPAHSRKSYNVAYYVPLEWEVSTMVKSTNGVGVIAERAMYGDPK